ncbi:MAG: glycerol-3-phosphate acyltransferase [Dehalococcoidia bacterium]|nr:MAG: glycerol-3-phosphate acyltransferase [Dehalococcoidia bacterium]
MVAESVITIVSGYLIGSIPFAYIVGRLIKGIDIRRVGGFNVGATNVMREVGTVPGFVVFFADIGKGTVAILIAQWLDVPLVAVFVSGLAAVVGHCWPVFLGFYGGRGAAVTIGIFFVLVPLECAISFGVMVLVVLATSNFRLASGLGFAFLPFIIWGFGGDIEVIIFSIALPLFTAIRAAPALMRSLKNPRERKNLIFDRQYKPWQSKK